MIGEEPPPPAMQRLGAGEPLARHPPQGVGAGRPFAAADLITADVDESGRKHLTQLVEHVTGEPGGAIAHVEHVRGDSPRGAHLGGRVAEPGTGGDRGLGVPGELDLGDHGHAAVGRVVHQAALGVEAPVRGPVEPALPCVTGRGLGTGGSDLGEPRVAAHLEPPPLVVGEVQVQDVELVQRQQVDVRPQKGDRTPPASHVDHHAAPGVPGHVANGAALHAAGPAQLAQRLDAPAQPGGSGRGDPGLVRGDGERVSLLPQGRVVHEVKGDLPGAAAFRLQAEQVPRRPGVRAAHLRAVAEREQSWPWDQRSDLRDQRGDHRPSTSRKAARASPTGGASGYHTRSHSSAR